jgi:hypothetical protein
MVKVTKSNPASKRNGVKKVCHTDYQQITKIRLTAMPGGVESFHQPRKGLEPFRD